MSRMTWEVVSWIGVAIALIAAFRVVRLGEQLGTEAIRGMPQTWLLLGVAILAMGPLAFSFYRYDWAELTQGAGAGQYILFVLGGLVLAAILNAVRLALT